MTMGTSNSRNWLDIGIKALLMLGIGLLLTVVLAWEVPMFGQIDLEAGDVASVDVVAPRQITYESEVLTQRAKDRVALSVPDYYEPPQGRVRRQQVSRSREILTFISVVRADAYTDAVGKRTYIAAIPDLSPVSYTHLTLPTSDLV